MKVYLYSLLVLLACLTFFHASHVSKNQMKKTALKELAAILAEEEARASSLSFKQQENDKDISQQHQQEDAVEVQQDSDDGIKEQEIEDLFTFINKELDKNQLKEQHDDSITYKQQQEEEDGNSDTPIVNYEENEENNKQDETHKDNIEKSQDDQGEV